MCKCRHGESVRLRDHLLAFGLTVGLTFGMGMIDMWIRMKRLDWEREQHERWRKVIYG